MSLWEWALMFTMLRISLRVSVGFYMMLPTRCSTLSSGTMSACMLPCPCHDDVYRLTLSHLPQLNIFSIRVAVVIVSLHNNKTPKTQR